MAVDELREALTTFSNRFDFGEYETKTYLAILEHGELTAADLANKADIPQPRVYDTVRGLADAGLVELQETRPLRVLAVDPQEAFGDVRSDLDQLVEELETQYTAPARRTEAASLIKSRSSILRYLSDVIESAEYELLVSVTPDLLGQVEAPLQERRESGVTTELLLSPKRNVPRSDQYEYRAVADTVRARRGITTPIIAVADGTYSIYTTREALAGAEDRYGVIFNRSELGFLVSGFFNTVLWSTADHVASDGSDRPFPRRYATIRRCISDLQNLDGEYTAEIEGRDIVTGEHRSVHGRVLEASFGQHRETATLTIETETGTIDVGGQVAAFEDIEAHTIEIDHHS